MIDVLYLEHYRHVT